jgi:anti-sigma28 factor (negative regulator of flagellin synthesis)
MTINPAGLSRPRIEGTVPARSAPGTARVSDESQVRHPDAPVSGQRDVLDLSPAARALVARSEDEGSLSAERLLQIRQRILDGTYDSPVVLDAVAAALRSSRDLR